MLQQYLQDLGVMLGGQNASHQRTLPVEKAFFLHVRSVSREGAGLLILNL
jgi:hypothetical protein